jgi:hypothetical protein
MIEAICCSETAVVTTAIWRHIPEDGILHSHRREDLKSYFRTFPLSETLHAFYCLLRLDVKKPSNEDQYSVYVDLDMKIFYAFVQREGIQHYDTREVINTSIVPYFLFRAENWNSLMLVYFHGDRSSILTLVCEHTCQTCPNCSDCDLINA